MSGSLARFIVLSESRTGFKYDSIWKRLPYVIAIEGGFLSLLKKAFFNIGRQTKTIYHIRYLKAGRSAYLRYLILGVLKTIGVLEVIWSCHNIRAHNIQDTTENKRTLELVARIASQIIVFHEDLKAFLPSEYQHKIRVACFGDMAPFVEGQEIKSIAFEKLFSKWKEKAGEDEGVVISISAAKISNLSLALRGLCSLDGNGVFVAPMVPKPNIVTSSKILYFNEGFVRDEVKHLLRMRKVIGYVGHSNRSVPTSIYMYASYGIPVIGLDVLPVNSLISEFSMGKVVSTPEGFKTAVEDVLDDYEFYSQNSRGLTRKYTWEYAARIHGEILSGL